MAIRVRGLTYAYHRGTPQEVPALRGVDLDVPAGTFLALVGAVGSGKSTLVQHLNGLLRPQGGQVEVLDVDVGQAPPSTLRRLRFQVGLVFQYPEHQLFAETVREDIAFGPRNMGLAEPEVEARIHRALEAVGLPPALLDRSPFSLSGGQRRRVAIAGVLAMDPQILILDEPAAGLDPRGRREMLELVARWHRRGKTVILVTHDMAAAAQARQVAVMQEGRVRMAGTPREVFQQAEVLEAAGLAVPPVTQVLLGLRRRGVAVPTGCLTVEEAAGALWPLLGGDRS